MSRAVHPGEPGGGDPRLEAFDVVDPGSASFALEDLLAEAAGQVPGPVLDDLMALLDTAHDHFSAGRPELGTTGLRAFEDRVEDLREAGTVSPSFAGDLLSLSEAAIAWADDQPGGEIVEESLWFDDLPGDEDDELAW